MTTKAQSEKEKGNAAFKTGDYPNAIGHYTAAILADRTDYTFPLNRAAAYLKLGKNEDAERDCTAVLNLNVLNAKALFRRGQARLALGKLEEASTDLTQALKREPSNVAIREELKKVTEQLDKKKAKTSKPSNLLAPTTPAHKRRRVPIKIIDPAISAPATGSSPSSASSKPLFSHDIVPSSANVDILKPVSTRSLKPEASTTTPPSSQATTETPIRTSATKPDQSRTFKDAKQEREAYKPSRVGGGIFRANGESTVFPTREIHSVSPTTPSLSDPTPASRSTGPILPVAPEKLPKTLFDFTRTWDVEHSTAARWGLILSIPPSTIPTLFKISLEPSQLTSILNVFHEVLSASVDDVERVKGYMHALAKVERFGTVVLFLSLKEKAVARSVWNALGVAKTEVGKAWSAVWS